MKKSISYSLMAAVLLTASGLFTSCEKVSPTGVLIGNTSVDDRVKQSLVNFSSLEVAWDKDLADTIQEYSFLVGSDSHITEDPGRLEEMIEIGMEHDDLFYCHLGDLADTKTEYYNNTEMVIQRETEKWMDKYLVPVYKEDGDVYSDTTLFTDPRTGDIYLKNKFNIFPTNLPFYPVVGNHDITHNGWALYSRIFKTSFYEFTVRVINDNDTVYDRFIFLDSANGTLGNYQIDEIENGLHPTVVKKMIELFYNPETNPYNAQLICTTHNILLINEAVQRDEVWLMDKNEYGESSMKHISDISGLRSYDKLGQKMIEGAFGAMPNIITNTQ